MLDRPIEHGADVVDLGRDEVEVPFAGDSDCRACARTIGERDQPVGLMSPQRIFLIGGCKVFPRELADRLEHPVALLPVRIGAAADQALVDERRKRVEVRVTDRFGRLESAAAAEDCEPGEQPLFVGVQEVVAPGDRRT